jgi:hypothetical protein
MGQWPFSCEPRRNDAAISGKLKKYLDEQYIRGFFVLFDPINGSLWSNAGNFATFAAIRRASS